MKSGSRLRTDAVQSGRALTRLWPERKAVRFVCLGLAITTLCLAAPASAGAGKQWTDNTWQNFQAGKAKGVTIHQRGRLTLGPKLEQIEGVSGMAVWDIAASPDGQIVAATGNPGVVYQVAEKKAEILFRSSEEMVLSLLYGKDGGLYAGTGTRAIIYRIGGANDVRVFVTLPENYIWDMALDANGNILAATGPNGRLYRITPDGKADVVFTASQRNLLSLAYQSGAVFVGTDTKGLLYRVTDDGKATVAHDSGLAELRGLAPDEAGGLFFCASAAPSPQGAQGGAIFVELVRGALRGGSAGGMNAKQADEGMPQQQPGAPQQAMPQMQGGGMAGGGKSHVFVRRADGELRTLVSFPDKQVYCLSPAGGNVVIGTGNDGRLYLLDAQQEISALFDRDEAQITAMLHRPGIGVYFGTANSGGLVFMGEERAASGAFESRIFDAGYSSKWGIATWREIVLDGADVKLSTRSGNSAEPDATWSEWAAEIDAPGAKIQSPPARFLQYRLSLSTANPKASPVAYNVQLAYRNRNRQPEVANLAVDGQNPADGGQGKPGQPGPQPRRQGGTPAPAADPGSAPFVRTIAWQAQDPDGDDLKVRLDYKGIDETTWKKIQEDLPVQGNVRWDTSRVPDGEYEVRLTVSDSPANPPEDSRENARTTDPFQVDNTRPLIEELKSEPAEGGGFILSGVAKDNMAALTQIMFSVNAEDWQPAFPEDGILDAAQENFKVKIAQLPPGEHAIVFMASDASGNTGSSKIVLQVK
ncbi:MAG TPA: hypothetical protein PL033_20170 [Candidatus Brocadiia bacterium]|nr:hypothetical protein [Candidatus Brocadiia bacterium]